MSKKTIVILLTAVGALLSAAASAASPAPKIAVMLQSTARPLYKVNENAPFTLTVKQGDDLFKSGTAEVVFTNSFGKTLKTVTVDLAKNNPAKFTETMSEPGIMVAYVSSLKNANGKKIKLRGSFKAAAGFEVEKIAQVDKEPADFMQFWQKVLADVKNAPVKCTPLAGKKYKNHDPFLLTVDMPDGEKVYATLLMPKKRQAGKSMISISIPGAGPGSANKWVSAKSDSNIIIHMHVHKYAPSFNSKEMKAKLKEYEKKLGKRYYFEGCEKPETYFYYRVIPGFSRIIDYAATFPEWDQKNLIVTGSSQGGFLTTALAALNSKITVISVNEPGWCDHAGWQVGRRGGGPQLHSHNPASDKTAQYYELCNFANYIKVPVFMAVGYIDSVAPPSSCYAAFNRIKSPKKMLPMFTSDHSIPPEYSKGAAEFLKKHMK